MVYFNWYFAYFFFVVNILLFIYKGYKFYYPPSALGWEVAMIFFLAIVDLCRLFLVSKGNKTEHIGPLVWSLGLTVPIIVAYSYYIDLQTYVLRVDLILNAMGLTFVSLEFFASVMAAMTFYSSFRG